MKRFRRTAVAVTGAALVVAPATAAQAGDRGHGHGGDAAVTTVATGLDGPRQLNGYRGHRVVVAEADSGEVSAVSRRTGEVETLLSGLYSPQGVDFDRNRLFVATGGPPPPEDAGPGAEPSVAPEGAASLVVAEPGGEVLQTIDLLAYELAANPDGQQQFDDDGLPIETLSNPYAVLAQSKRVLVADAGANAVLSVDRRTGEVSTFFVPPVVTDVPGCAEAPNNPGTVGCDPVPTGITEGPWGLVYVSTLGAEVPGAGRVYVLTPHGSVVHVIDDLTAPTGLAVDRRGTVYVSNVAEGFPEEGPGPDLDPSTIGEVTRIAWHGERSTAQVTMPTGLLVDGGELYASAWSVASFLGLPAGSGELVRVGQDAFTPSGG